MKQTTIAAFGKYACQGDSLIITLTGEIDHHAAAYLREELDLAIYKYKPKNVILDFTRVPFMDSSGLGLAVGRYQSAKATGATLTVRVGKNRVCQRIFQMAGLERLEGLFFEATPEVKEKERKVQ